MEAHTRSLFGIALLSGAGLFLVGCPSLEAVDGDRCDFWWRVSDVYTPGSGEAVAHAIASFRRSLFVVGATTDPEARGIVRKLVPGDFPWRTRRAYADRQLFDMRQARCSTRRDARRRAEGASAPAPTASNGPTSAMPIARAGDWRRRGRRFRHRSRQGRSFVDATVAANACRGNAPRRRGARRRR